MHIFAASDTNQKLGKCDCHEEAMASLALTSYIIENVYFQSVTHSVCGLGMSKFKSVEVE